MYIMYHNDPGHGWYAVPVSELVRLRIHTLISSCSYVSFDGATAYLEEDCDASTYFGALEEDDVDTKEIEVVNRYSENIFVRNMPHYTHGIHFDTYSKLNYNLAKWREYQKEAVA